MREKLTAEITENIAKGNHILLKGKHGVGKSFLAQELAKANKNSKKEYWIYFPYCKPPKQILLETLEALTPKGKDNPEWKMLKRGTILELCQNISEQLKKNNKKLILILDELHTISASSASSYHLLMQASNKITFLAVATDQYLDKKVDKPEMKRLFWELKNIEMLPLSQDETKELLDGFISLYEVKIDSNMQGQIIKNAQGNPLAIKKAVENISKNEDPQITQHGAIRNDAVNLFPIFIFMVFILIGMKYLMRVSEDYELANLSGFVGIILFFCLRFLWMRKKNN